MLGEVRGNHQGESRDHLHAGLDIRGDVGQTVYAIAIAKDADAAEVVHAADSGAAVHGSAHTRFRNLATKRCATAASPRPVATWRAARRDYLIRIAARDYRNNQATANRDLPATLE